MWAMDTVVFRIFATHLCVCVYSLGILGDLVEGKRVNVGVHTEQERKSVDVSINSNRFNNEFIVQLIPASQATNTFDSTKEVLEAVRDQQIDAVLGIYNHTTYIVSEKKNIPYVLTSLSGARGSGSHVFNMLPDSGDIVDCILKLLKKFDWHKVGILCEQYVDPNLLSTLLQTPEVDLRLWQLSVDVATINMDHLRTKMMQMRKLGIKQILLLTRSFVSTDVLKMARRLGMVAHPYSWIMLNLGSEDFTANTMLDMETNAMVVRFVDSSVAEKLYKDTGEVINPLGTSTIDDALLLLDRAQDTSDSAPLVDSIKKISVEGKTGVINFDEEGRRTNFSFAIYHYNDNTFDALGRWRKPIAGLSELKMNGSDTDDDIPPEYPLEGRTVRAVTILEEPWCRLKRDHASRQGNDRFEGFSVDIMEEISRLNHFSYDLYIVNDGQFGALLDNGEWNGIVGEVRSGNASMSVAPLSINAAREEAMDFTKPFKTRGITVLIKTPESQSSYFEFMSPLSTKVWVCVLIAMAVVSVVLYLVERRSKGWRKDLPRINAAESMWFVFGAIAGGSTESSPITLPGRVVTSGWWFFSLILISTYTANLAAFLTVKKINPPISSVADLVGQTRIKYGTVRNSGVLAFFQNTNIKPYSDMRNYMDLVPDVSLVNNTEDGLNRVRGGDYAFLWDNSVNKYIASTDCSFTEIGPAFDPKGFGIGLPSGSTYRDELSMSILKLGDSGKISELEDRWWGKSECPDFSKPLASTDETSELELENVAGIFFVLGAGAILSFLACGLDRLWFRNRGPEQTKVRIKKKKKNRKERDNNGTVHNEHFKRIDTEISKV